MADTEPLRTCPRCASHFLDNSKLEANALSRTTRDENQDPTYVCTWCGMQEGLEQMGGRLSPQGVWPVVHNIPIYASVNS